MTLSVFESESGQKYENKYNIGDIRPYPIRFLSSSVTGSVCFTTLLYADHRSLSFSPRLQRSRFVPQSRHPLPRPPLLRPPSSDPDQVTPRRDPCVSSLLLLADRSPRSRDLFCPPGSLFPSRPVPRDRFADAITGSQIFLGGLLRCVLLLIVIHRRICWSLCLRAAISG